MKPPPQCSGKSAPAAMKNVSAHLPGSAVLAGQQLAGFRIADDLLFLHVPADLLPGEHRDEAEVAGNRRVMPNLDRSYSGLPGADAVQKVLHVVGGSVKFYLSQFTRQVLSLLPGWVRRIKATAVHPDPALS